jgi:hypothetical protein
MKLYCLVSAKQENGRQCAYEEVVLMLCAYQKKGLASSGSAPPAASGSNASFKYVHKMACERETRYVAANSVGNYSVQSRQI